MAAPEFSLADIEPPSDEWIMQYAAYPSTASAWPANLWSENDDGPALHPQVVFVFAREDEGHAGESIGIVLPYEAAVEIARSVLGMHGGGGHQ